MLKSKYRLITATAITICLHASLLLLPSILPNVEIRENRIIKIDIITNTALVHGVGGDDFETSIEDVLEKESSILTAESEDFADEFVDTMSESDGEMYDLLEVDSAAVETVNSTIDSVFQDSANSLEDDDTARVVEKDAEGAGSEFEEDGFEDFVGGGVSVGVSVASQVEPVYSLRARRRGLEGRCVFKLIIGIDGAVKSIVLVQSSGHEELDKSARTALELSRFSPAMENGVPVESEFEYTIRFQLND